ncbi:MAG: glucosamine-6-phosphate deaminase [Planctomycetota bacterium]
MLTPNRTLMGQYVGSRAGSDLRDTINHQGHANLLIATGASQFEVLAELAKQPDIDWSRVTGFHLDEYVGLNADHPASFCRYLRERFVDLVPLREFHFIDGMSEPSSTIEQLSTRLSEHPIDVALVGIGENGHLAFNDPPADFETEEPYLHVKLDQKCREQQVGEGWFESFESVPETAISMSIQQILKSRKIYCSVPDSQKAEAVAATIQDDVTPNVPASILKTHDKCILIIDEASSSSLTSKVRDQLDRFGFE